MKRKRADVRRKAAQQLQAEMMAMERARAAAGTYVIVPPKDPRPNA
jgi:hypothetical protein